MAPSENISVSQSMFNLVHHWQSPRRAEGVQLVRLTRQSTVNAMQHQLYLCSNWFVSDLQGIHIDLLYPNESCF